MKKEESIITVKVNNHEEFMRKYLNYLSKECRLSDTQIEAMVYIWKNSTLDPNGGGNIYLDTKEKRAELIETYPISSGALSGALGELMSKKLISKKIKGVFILNPDVFFKGTITEKSKLELRVMYN